MSVTTKSTHPVGESHPPDDEFPTTDPTRDEEPEPCDHHWVIAFCCADCDAVLPPVEVERP